MNCFISINSKNKAKRDIDALMREMGYKNLAIKGVGKGHVETFIRKSLSMINLLLRLHKSDILIIQYPFKKFYTLQCRIAHLKGAKVITLIHDLGSFRRRKLTVEQEIHCLSHTDYIIAHNPKMKEWIMEQATKFLPHKESRDFFENKIGCLNIFDYLSEVEPHLHSGSPHHNHITYAGGLGVRKNSFLYQAGQAMPSCLINLYGSGNLNPAHFAPNIRYHGHIESDDFIRQAQGNWGLVWDGDSIEACSGIWGTYLKYNNPHKTSFYIRAGLPVIVWKESAMAPFVESEGVGLSVKSLREVEERIAAVSNEQYQQICANVLRMSRQLNEGYYFHKAINDALHTIQHQS